ncbi:hypothetical protein KTE68_22110 [Burkholderia multivorans]|uniref:hypothetical protein n=1 Tax=Burkholderia multivorans TaxID=87883 RepID=UPI001C250181|nr:hypothetical protein [Burkholderia multivorans]MBU9502849.1 hypothetical protein [Burkholderia multivorans]
MKLSEFLENVGHPVAYYPALAGPLGGVNAAVLFCQLYYWSKRSPDERGVHKTVEELRAETGMSRAEQETARKALKARGVLSELHIRLEHKMFYKLDLDVLERLMEERANSPEQGDESEREKVSFPKARKSRSGKRESDVRERENPAFAKAGNSDSGTRESSVPEAAIPAFVNEGKTTTETTAEKNPLTPLSPAAPTTSVGLKGESKLTPFERWWDAWPRTPRRVAKAECEKRWRRAGLDEHVEVIVAHTLAMKLTQPWRDGYEPAPLTYLNQRRWQDPLPPTEAEAAAEAADAEWWSSAEAVEQHAARIGFRARHADEPTPAYRVLVAKASGRGPWIDFVLKHAEKSGSQRFYEWVRAQLGEELLPTDDYAS